MFLRIARVRSAEQSGIISAAGNFYKKEFKKGQILWQHGAMKLSFSL